MFDARMRRHGLEKLLDQLPPADQSDLIVTINPDRNYFNLRGDSSATDFLTVVNSCTGLELPLSANTFIETAEHQTPRIFWLGPDEWLIETRPERNDKLLTNLEQALKGLHHSLVVVSGGNICLTLRGEKAREVLAKGCTLDLHPSVFKAGDCAQTGLAKAAVLLAATDDEGIDILVRRSFAEYLLLWFKHSGKEFEIRLGIG